MNQQEKKLVGLWPEWTMSSSAHNTASCVSSIKISARYPDMQESRTEQVSLKRQGMLLVMLSNKTRVTEHL